MKRKAFVGEKLKSYPKGARLAEEKQYRLVAFGVLSLIFNLFFALYNGILGVMSRSLVLAASAVYYLLLGAMRFSAVLMARNKGTEERASKVIGLLLVILSLFYPLIIFFSIGQNLANVYDTITMITVATYTFTKIALAVVNEIKQRKNCSKLVKGLNAIRYAEAGVSLFTMQQSMLVSFGDGRGTQAVTLNALTGAGVCIFILSLGILTLRNSRKEG